MVNLIELKEEYNNPPFISRQAFLIAAILVILVIVAYTVLVRPSNVNDGFVNKFRKDIY